MTRGIVIGSLMACAALSPQPTWACGRGKVTVCHEGRTRNVGRRMAELLVARGEAEYGECEQVAICVRGLTQWVDPARADRLIGAGRAAPGECQGCDFEADDDGKVAVCRNGRTQQVSPRRACRLLADGRAELGPCDEGRAAEPPAIAVDAGPDIATVSGVVVEAVGVATVRVEGDTRDGPHLHLGTARR